jgi:predicted transcriptional regulator
MSDPFDELQQWLQDPGRHPDDAIHIPLELVPKILTPNRTRLIAHLERHGPADSVQALATDLGRNYASVSRDLGYLIGAGFLDVEQQGHRKRVKAAGRVIVVGPGRAKTVP